jgi:hypothetical protein
VNPQPSCGRRPSPSRLALFILQHIATPELPSGHVLELGLGPDTWLAISWSEMTSSAMRVSTSPSILRRGEEGTVGKPPFLMLDQFTLQIPDELTMRPPNCSTAPSGVSFDIGELWLARTLLISSDTRSAVSLESKLKKPPT